MIYRVCRMIVLLIVSCAIAVWIVLFNMRGVGMDSPLTAFCAACGALGIVVVNSSTIRWSLPEPVKLIRHWEISGSVYRLLGVSIFGSLLRRPPLRYTNTSVYTERHRGDLAKTHSSILKAETAHFWAFAFTLPLIAYQIACRSWRGLFWLMLFNALFHVYPGLHLRSVRGRIESIALKRRRRT